MTVRRINFILWTACGLFVAGSLIALLTALIVPVQVRRSQALFISAKSNSPSAAKLISAQSLAPVYSRIFRQSLDGTTSAASSSAKPSDTASPAEIALDGTIGTGLAILKGPDGTEALAEVGDDVNGAVIVAIRPSEVDLRNTDGSIITLRRPAENDPAVLTPQDSSQQNLSPQNSSPQNP